MFSRVIRETPYTSPDANTLFKGIIEGDDYNGDVTLLSSLRHMYADLVKEKFGTFNVRYIDCTDSIDKDDYAVVESRKAENNVLFICYRRYGKEDDKYNHYIENVEKILNEEGFKKDVTMQEFYDVRCYTDTATFINEERMATFFFSKDFTQQCNHFMQNGLPGLVRYFYDVEDLPDSDVEVCEAFSEKTPDKIMDIFNRGIKRYDLDSMRIRRIIGDFEVKKLSRDVRELRDRYENLVRTINETMESLRNYLDNKEDTSIRLSAKEEALRTKQNRPSDMVDFFLRHREVSLEELRDEQLTIVVNTYIMYFDEDVLRRSIENKNSWVYQNADEDEDKAKIRALFEHLFIEQDARMKVYGKYRIESNYVSAINGDIVVEDRYENPHLHHYTCLGGNSRAIEEYLMNGDYVGAVEQCMASAASINFEDSPVMSKFIRDLYSIENKIIEYKGEVYSPSEAMEVMTNEEKKGE